MPWTGKTYEETLVASAARTANGSAETNEPMGDVARVQAQLNVTAVSGTTPTLNVVLETTLDGVNWTTMGTFAQKTAAAREVVMVNPWVGRRLRVTWTVGGTTPSFTFEVRIVAEKGD